jgi:magnesium-transporting ATPase (P-type)
VRRVRAASVRDWWRQAQTANLVDLHARPEGLTRREAAARLRRDGPNRLPTTDRVSLARSIARRLANPLILVLLAASAISAFTGDPVSFGFIAVIVSMSIALDMVQEHRAGRAMEALRSTVACASEPGATAPAAELPAAASGRGDVVELSAGDLIPPTAASSRRAIFFVNQASLTGEAWPSRRGVERRRRRDRSPARMRSSWAAASSPARRGCSSADWTADGLRTLARSLAEPPRADIASSAARAASASAGATDGRAGPVRPADQHAVPPLRCSSRSCSPVALAVGLTPNCCR